MLSSVAADSLSGTTAIEPGRRWVDAWPVLAVVVAIAACEWIFVYRDVAYGITIAMFLALCIYLANALLITSKALDDCFTTLALIPLYILFTSSLPWFFIDQQYLVPAVYSVVLILCFFYIYQQRLEIAKIINLRSERLGLYLLLGLFCGLPLGIVEFLVLAPAAAYPSFEISYLLQQTIYMTCFVGVGEELLFRGLIQNDLIRLLGSKYGLLLSGLLFSIMHLTWRSMPELGFTFLAGLAFGFVYYRTRSLIVPIIMHGVGNVVLVAVMPYLLH